MKVLKFGGSSVAKPERIESIAKLINERVDNIEQLTIVFSAFGGVTDQLIRAANLASKGKKEYLEKLKHIHNRHSESIVQLISSPDIVSETKEHIDQNFDILGDLLKGVKP